MLFLEAKADERIVLFDMVSRARTAIRIYRRRNGNIGVEIDAPSEIDITRERWGKKNGDERASRIIKDS